MGREKRGRKGPRRKGRKRWEMELDRKREERAVVLVEREKQEKKKKVQRAKNIRLIKGRGGEEGRKEKEE